MSADARLERIELGRGKDKSGHKGRRPHIKAAVRVLAGVTA